MPPSFARNDETGTPFSRIFLAVFSALCAYGLLQFVIVSLMARAAANEAVKQLQAIERSVSQPAPVPLPRPTNRPASVPEQLPLHLGPMGAIKFGAKRACINGLVAERLEDGWNQTRQACRAHGE